MIDRLLLLLTLVTALGCGLIAGAFFAFSSFVMSALGRLPPAQGITAMQSINVVVINPVFLGVFLGTAMGCFVLAISAVLRWDQPGSLYLLIGGLLYLVGTFLVTMIFNVPLNDALAAADPTSASGTALWERYLASWTAWNHARTLAALAATALLAIAALLAVGWQPFRQ